MEKWEEGYYITAMAGSTGGSSLVVMSKGTPYTQQSYKVHVLCRAFQCPPCKDLPVVPVVVCACAAGANQQQLDGNRPYGVLRRCPIRSRSSGLTKSGRRAST